LKKIASSNGSPGCEDIISLIENIVQENVNIYISGHSQQLKKAGRNARSGNFSVRMSGTAVCDARV
jgi:hypothetical protein